MLPAIIAIIPFLIFSGKKEISGPVDDKQKVQHAIDSIRAELVAAIGDSVPSLNVLIETPSQKIFVSSVPDNKSLLTADTWFRFASNTKNFTSTAILNMYEEGWLNYKSRITDLIPGSTVSYVPTTPAWNIPNKNEITIEQLLQHAAGVYDVDNDSVPGYNGAYVEHIKLSDPFHQFSAEELVGVDAAKQLSYFKPGEGYHYSNTGYTILGEIIARVYSFKSGKNKSYADYLNDYIIGPNAPVPLHVHFPDKGTDVSLPSPFVQGVVYNAGDIEHHIKDNVSAHVAEGNGYGTMNELNTYIRTLMKGKNVLKPATIELMQNDVSAHNSTYGLGCTNNSNLGFGHNGAKVGYLSLMVYDPKTDVSVVVMLPVWDLKQGMDSFLKTFTALYDAGYAARVALGYPGKP